MSTATAEFNSTALDEILTFAITDSAAKRKYFAPNFFSLPIDTALLAIVICQVVNYNSTYPTDPLRTKILVWTVLATCVVSTALDFAWCYKIFILNFGSYHTVVATVNIYPLYVTYAVIVCGVQAHYISKVYLLWKRNIWLTALCVVPALFVVVGAFGMLASTASVPSLLKADASLVTADKKGPFTIFGIMLIYSSMVTDIAISALIVIALLRSRTGWSKTDSLIRKLVAMTFECQGPPTIFALALGIQWAPKQDVVLSMPYLILVGKVYANSLLFSLNARAYFKGETSRGASDSHQDQMNNTFQLSRKKADGRPFGTINVEVETYKEITDSGAGPVLSPNTPPVLYASSLDLRRADTASPQQSSKNEVWKDNSLEDLMERGKAMH